MQKIFATFDRWYGRRTVRFFLVGVIVLLVLGFFFSRGDDAVPVVSDSTQKVRVATVAELGGDASAFNTVGEVRAISEARLQTESAGRVTSVRVAIGDRVAAGAILATLENSSESAALLSAQGAYEAAFANAAQSGRNLENAREDARQAYRNAYITARDVYENDIDPFFTGQNRIRFDLGDYWWEQRLIGYGLNDWQEQTLPAAVVADSTEQLSDAIALVQRMLTLTNSIFEGIVSYERSAPDTDEATIAAFRADVQSAQTSLGGALATLTNAVSGLEDRAAASAGADTPSAADAQVKQALGSLRAAQATYENTLVRTPIGGVVNAMYLRANEYAGMGAPAAVVANNSALEVTTYINETDRDIVLVGGTVSMEGAAGTVTHIAPAIDPATRKIEVKIATDADTLQNGDSVRVTFESAEALDADAPLFLPIVTVKLSGESAHVFTVVEGALVAHPVELGAIRGDTIEIRTGVSTDMTIVTDARGLAAGETVEIRE